MKKYLMNSLGHTTEVIDKPLTAYELADELDNWTDNHESANMLRQQADRIAELEKGLELVKDAYCDRDSECRQLKAQTKPLSDEEIEKIAIKKIGSVESCGWDNLFKFARAIEAKVRGEK